MALAECVSTVLRPGLVRSGEDHPVGFPLGSRSARERGGAALVQKHTDRPLPAGQRGADACGSRAGGRGTGWRGPSGQLEPRRCGGGGGRGALIGRHAAEFLGLPHSQLFVVAVSWPCPQSAELRGFCYCFFPPSPALASSPPCPAACPSFCPSSHPVVRPSTPHLSTCTSTHLSVRLSFHPSIRYLPVLLPTVHLCARPPTCPAAHPPATPSSLCDCQWVGLRVVLRVGQGHGFRGLAVMGWACLLPSMGQALDLVLRRGWG